MSLGTLSETRTMATTNLATSNNKPPILEVQTTTLPADPVISTTNVDPAPAVTPPTLAQNQNMATTTAAPAAAPAQPAVSAQPTTATPQACTYCKAKSVAGLAFQMSLIVLILALSFNLVKKAA